MLEEPKPISPAALLIDLQNPRIPYDTSNQRDGLRAVAALQNEKILRLADSIVAHGLNPAELPIVMLADDEPERYRVLEGNRRLTALRALENPEVFVGALAPGVLDQVRKLSLRYQQNPIPEVQCHVVKGRSDADYWIKIRHTGQNSGAGIVDWDSDQASRFYARSGGALRLHTRLLDFLEARGRLSSTERQRIKTTSFRRLVETPEVRDRIGIEMHKDGGLRFLADEATVIEALLYIINDLGLPERKVGDIYTREQRVEYAEKLPVGTPVAGEGQKTNTASQAHQPKTAAAIAKRVPLARMKRLRERLIPSDCLLRIGNPRIRRIEIELRGLDLKEYTNAIAVLFRVFIELSVDAYIEKEGLPRSEEHTSELQSLRHL